MPNKNTNCLANMECPRCKSTGPFYIEIKTTVLMYDDGSGDTSDMAWEDSASCSCHNCKFKATAKDFACD